MEVSSGGDNLGLGGIGLRVSPPYNHHLSYNSTGTTVRDSPHLSGTTTTNNNSDSREQHQQQQQQQQLGLCSQILNLAGSGVPFSSNGGEPTALSHAGSNLLHKVVDGFSSMSPQAGNVGSSSINPQLSAGRSPVNPQSSVGLLGDSQSSIVRSRFMSKLPSKRSMRAPRMRWTSTLHAHFVHAVELLGGHESKPALIHCPRILFEPHSFQFGLDRSLAVVRTRSSNSLGQRLRCASNSSRETGRASLDRHASPSQ